MKLQTLPVLLLCLIFTQSILAQEKITRKLNFDTDEFSIELEFEYALGYNFEPYFKTKLNHVKVLRYKNPVHDYVILREKGYSFPYTVKYASVDLQANGIIYRVNGSYPKTSEKFIQNSL